MPAAAGAGLRPVGIGGKDAYLDQLRRQLAASGAVARRRHRRPGRLPRRGAAEFPRVRLHGGVSASTRCRRSRSTCAARPADLCYIQFSSGSTRHPHGVQITQAALMANLAGITGPAGLEVVAGDRAASWLPLYHDMGLIGFLMAPLSTSSRSTT
jgi:fatty-acyl-CoA synthase